MSLESMYKPGEMALVELDSGSFIECEVLETNTEGNETVFLVALTTSPKIVTFVGSNRMHKMPPCNDVTTWENCVWQPEGMGKKKNDS